MRVVLFSKQVDDKSNRLNLELKGHLEEHKESIVYLSLEQTYNKSEYDKKLSYYRSLGIGYLDVLRIQDMDRDKIRKKILEYKYIHIPDVKLEEAVKSIGKFDLYEALKEFSNNGGTVIAEGEAGVLLSCNSKSYNLLVSQNEEENFKALGILDFDFIPHWNQIKNKLCGFIDCSKLNKGISYAVSDGSGIIVNDDKIEFYGDIIKIENGDFKLFKGK